MKDYYRTLGVIDDAEDIVIRAAYKALAQRYHPDKWKGEQQEANKRMSDINEAYDVLSDSAKRKKYDEEYFRYRARDESAEEDDTYANFISEDDEAWQIALEFFPKIKDEYLYLLKISGILANTFKATIINSQDYKNSATQKQKLENDYLKRYYGEDVLVQDLVKELLMHDEKKAAIRINKIVRALGTSVSYEQIKEKILQEFPSSQKCIYELPTIKKLKIRKITSSEILKCFKYIFGKEGYSIKINQKIFTGDFVFTFNVGEKEFKMSENEITEFLLIKLNEKYMKK